MEFINCKFEILSEEDEEINIDKIKEFIIPEMVDTKECDMWHNRIKINQLIKAVKQLNNKIKE